MMKSSELKNGLLISLLTTLIVSIFFQPLLDFLYKFIPSLTADIYQGYINNIYKGVARNRTDWIYYSIYGIVNAFLACRYCSSASIIALV